MKTVSANRAGGWFFALTTLGVVAALFVRLPSRALGDSGIQWFEFQRMGAVLALALAAAAAWLVRKRLGPEGTECDRKFQTGMLLVLLHAIFLRAAIELAPVMRTPARSWWPVEAWLWTPWFLTTGLAAMLLGSRLGMLTSLASIFVLYLRADPGPLPLVGALVSSAYGILLLRRPTRRRALRAGAGAGALLATVALIHALHGGGPIVNVAAVAAAPLLVGLVSAFALLAALPVLEWMLGELSDVTLVEHASEHPLLDRLKEEAPGTWHHSLNVADLAEKAASAIGARALFCRTAALYHDIGKVKNPSLFAENIEGPSPHDQLDPHVSAQRIIAHVPDGLDLAREHGLPKPFRDIIAEHHGVSVVRFFYAKACAQLSQGQDPESLRASFAYPGPQPSSRESGIIALADAVEAATRSSGAQTAAESRAFVRKLIAERICEGDLAHCPLTLAELAVIEETFVRWVQARDHHRPRYPVAPEVSPAKATGWAKSDNAVQPV